MIPNPRPECREAFHDWLRADCRYVLVLPLPGGRWAGLLRLIFHWTVHVGRDFDFHSHDDRWCYATAELAIAELAAWAGREFEGEPDGWHKHPRSGRVRPNGNAAREHLQTGTAAW